MSKIKITYKEILKHLGEHEVIGNKEKIAFKSIANITSNNKDSICFIDKNREDKEDLIDNSFANLILIDNKKIENTFLGKTLIKVDDPKLVFSKTGNAFFIPKKSKGIIHSSARIHKDAKIHKSISIGTEGFGYNKDIDGVQIQFPHIGRVIIESDVEIGANVTIDRGALSDTIIRKGVKFDNSVHVGHNVEVGRNTLLTAKVMIAGSTKL